MKIRTVLLFLAATGIAGASGTAVPQQHITRLEMGFDVGNGIVAPAGPARVRVPPGETVVLSVPSDSAVVKAGLQWTKDGKAIPGATNQAYLIASATSSDSGLYSLSGVPFPTVATGISLDVVPEGHAANMSSRVELQPKQTHIVGFVVSGHVAKSYLFRAVGPTLKAFGISNPAPRPRVRCFAADGHEVSFVHAAVLIDLNALFTSIGAFPVTPEELTTISYDYGSFSPGAYTLQVTDDGGGTALVELYEMGPGAVIKPAS